MWVWRFAVCSIFFYTYLFCLDLFWLTHMNPLSVELKSETPVQNVTFISCRMFMSHAIPFERNMTIVPPFLSCSSLGVLALETCNQNCLPSFSHLSRFFVTWWHLAALKSGDEEGGKKEQTSLMERCKTSKEFATPSDLEIARWVIVGGGGVVVS